MEIITKEKIKIFPGIKDSVFKKVFKECHKYRSFVLSEITKIDYDYLLNNTIIVDSEYTKDITLEKLKSSDVCLKIENDSIILEMNANGYYEGLVERNMAYLAKRVSMSAKAASKYSDLSKSYLISFDNYDRYKETNDAVIDFKMINVKNKLVETDKMISFHVVLTKIVAKAGKNLYNLDKLSKFERSILLLTAKTVEELATISKGDEILMEAAKIIKHMSMEEFLPGFDPEVEWQKELRDREAYAIKQGVKKGENREKIRNAKNLLKLNISKEIVTKATGLSIKELDKIESKL